MCIFGHKKAKPNYTPGVQPILQTETSLPEAKKVAPDDAQKDVQFGGKGARAEVTQQSQGAKSLMINLPNTQQPGGQTGGLGGV